MSRDEPQFPDGGTSHPADEPETMLCPSCMVEADPGADFCDSCGAPIGTFSTLDPIKAIHSQGWAYRRAISGRTSPFIFWGMLLIFGPAAVGSAAIIGFGGGSLHPVSVISAVLLLSLYGAILYRVTKGYLKYRRARPGRCYECGYPFHGLPEPRCPECGTRFDPDDLETDEFDSVPAHGQRDDSTVEGGASEVRATSPSDLLYTTAITFCFFGIVVAGWVWAKVPLYGNDVAMIVFWALGLLSIVLLVLGAGGIIADRAPVRSRVRWYAFVANLTLVLIWWILLGVI
ncbi:MAG: zinc ribbon domain-containing protein [bacterium]|nr:zinc ribbon domain-containing protein [bacterium]